MHAFEHEQEWVWIFASSVCVHTLRDRVHHCQSVHCGNKQGLKATYSSLNCRDGGRRGWGSIVSMAVRTHSSFIYRKTVAQDKTYPPLGELSSFSGATKINKTVVIYLMSTWAFS